MEALSEFMSHISLRTSAKLLLAIVVSEAVIMSSFRWMGVEMGSFWVSVADVLLLAAISSIVISYWVIAPLRKAKQQNDVFNALVENIDVGVVLTDPNTPGHPITFVNSAFCRITGYPVEEVIGRNPRFLQGEDVDQEALEQTRSAIRDQRSVRVLQKSRRKDGTCFWNDLHLNPIFNHHGDVQFWVGLVNDVTAARELERENIRWASALQQSDEAVCVFNQDGVIEYVNEAFCSNVRACAADLVGQSALSCWDESSADLVAARQSIEQGVSWSGRHKRCRSDKTTYDALTSITPIHDDFEAISFIGVHRDISDMVVMEEQFRQSQKMEAIGMLVGGIAHDFNNVLAGILGNLYLVKQQLVDSPKLHARIEGVEEQGYAAAGMVLQLLSFSRKGLPDVKEIDLVPFVRELLKFARVSVPESIQLHGLFEDEASFVVRCDAVQLQQSLLNLIVNATHAIAERGDVTGEIALRLHSSEAPDHLIVNDSWAYGEKPEMWVCLSLEDNGCGMDQDTQRKIFEPFFTTKSSSVGTGLGLAMVQGYIEMLRGVVDVTSSPGKGTRFDIYLPLSSNKVSIQEKERDEVRLGNGQCILVADDDDRVRRALCDILESANYNTIEACNGEEAMALFTEHVERLDMAILDIVMPKASGSDVAAHIRASHQEFPIAFMTGYDKENALALEVNSSHLLIRKPWDVSELNAVLIKAFI